MVIEIGGQAVDPGVGGGGTAAFSSSVADEGGRGTSAG